MNYDQFNAKEYLSAVEKPLDIPIEESWRPSVEMHLENAIAMMKILQAIDIDIDSIDLANTFTAR